MCLAVWWAACRQSAPAPQAMDAVAVEETIAVTGEARADAPAESAELRSDFSETAFWQPHLLTGADGTAALEFTVPDSVTSWNVWVHALTTDLRSGSAQRAGAERQGADGAAVPAALPARGRPGGDQGGGQQRRREAALRRGRVRDPRSRDRDEPAGRVRISAAEARQAFRVEPGQGDHADLPAHRAAAGRPGGLQGHGAGGRPLRRRAAPAAGPAVAHAPGPVALRRAQGRGPARADASTTWRAATIRPGSTSSWW